MLKDMSVMHPAAKMLVDLANAQDIEAGDGTTSVVVIAGSLLGAAEKLLGKGDSSMIGGEPGLTCYQRSSSYSHCRILPASGGESCGNPYRDVDTHKPL